MLSPEWKPRAGIRVMVTNRLVTRAFLRMFEESAMVSVLPVARYPAIGVPHQNRFVESEHANNSQHVLSEAIATFFQSRVR